MCVLKIHLMTALLTLTALQEGESADTKVLILGAGASGLNAAQTLHYKGENDFVILEAEDDYGGRVRDDQILDRLVEVGANWIRPVGSKLEDLAQAIKMATLPSDFDNIVAINDKSQIVTNEFKSALENFNDKLIDAVRFGEEYVDDDDIADMSLRAAFRSVGWRPNTPEERYAEWFKIDFDLGDEADRTSLKAFTADQLYVEEVEPVVEDNYENNNNNELTEYRERTDLVLVADNDPENYRERNRDNWNNWNSWSTWDSKKRRRRRQTNPDDQQEQFVIDRKGYRSIFNETMSFLLKEERYNIHYNKIVEQIDYSDDQEVTVYCTDGSRYTAEYVLVTFSLGVLQSDLIEFVPPLPTWKTDYWNRFEMGAYSKIFLNYDDEKFWEGDEYNKEWIAHVHSRKGQWPLFLNFAHENLFGRETHLLMAILTGDEARRVESLTVDDIKEEAKLNFDNMFDRWDENRLKPKSIIVSNWTQNPYTLGSFTFWALGTDRDCFDIMESRVERIFFAGEATSLHNTGNLQGALESGKREGLKIYDCLNGGYCEKCTTTKKCKCSNKSSTTSMGFFTVVLFALLGNFITRTQF